jgi:lactate permease
VAFGAIAIPIVTLAGITDLPKDDLGAMVGRQTPFLALIVPLILVGMVDGMRGIRQSWPAALVGGFAFALAQFACSNYVSVELTDIVASLLGRARSSLPARLAAERAAAAASASARPAIAGAAVADPTLEAEVARREERRHGLARRRLAPTRRT